MDMGGLGPGLPFRPGRGAVLGAVPRTEDGSRLQGVSSSVGKEGNSLEDKQLNLIQSMEIFDYTDVIYYAKLPFLTNGSYLDNWDCNRRAFSGQAHPAGACPRLSSLCDVPQARTWVERLKGNRISASCVCETRLWALEHTPACLCQPALLKESGAYLC